MIEPDDTRKPIQITSRPGRCAPILFADLKSWLSTSRSHKEALLSDLLTLSSYSPLLATTVLQNPEYVQWLGRERTDTKVRSKESLLESLSRFSLLHTVAHVQCHAGPFSPP